MSGALFAFRRRQRCDGIDPPHGQNRDERIEYGHRVARYAFGTAGDIGIANTQPMPEQINNFCNDFKLNEKVNQSKPEINSDLNPVKIYFCIHE